jgi:hypothetical protein
MKNKLYTLLAALLITASTFAQAPEKMSYQAVIRDAGNVLVSNQAVGMQISILQTTANGTAVYVETQTPTTNANGLVSIEIGMGNVVSGSFSAINWSAGPYFIKTETDPTGGTTYTITGTSQMLSVPYALHAKTSSNGIPSGGTEGQFLRIVNGAPVWVNSQVDFDGDGFTVADGDCNDNDADINPTEVEIGGDGIDNNCNGEIDEADQTAIGDIRKGGVVFYIAPSPTDLDGDGDLDNGLVCALSDYISTIEWGCSGINLPNVPNVNVNPLNNPPGARIGDGMTNTNGILAVCSSPAAFAARSLGPEWFLPSINELDEMFVNRTTLASVLGFISFQPNTAYWSSSEIDPGSAWYQNLTNGQRSLTSKTNNTLRVRAIRAF